MKFFKPEDFDDKDYTVGLNLFQKGQAAMWANAKLEREGKVCYGYMSDKVSFTADSNYCNQANATHRALLVCIEPISEPCKHPSENVKLKEHLRFTKEGQLHGSLDIYECSCGAKVKPSAFEAAE